MIELRRATHALVDGVRYPEALTRLYGRDDVTEVEPLYRTTRWQDMAGQGPILIRLQNAALVDEMLADGSGDLMRATSWLVSHETTQTLANHLRQFVQITATGRGPRLLRFADPLVARHWLESYGERVPAEVLGPIDTWWMAHWAPLWAPAAKPAWQAFRAPLDIAPDRRSGTSPAHFGPAQLDALETVSRWQFKERLAMHFALTAPRIWQGLSPTRRGQWLDDRLADAVAWGATTERQAAIWVELSLYWGADFMTRADGPYAQWYSRYPEADKLSHQQCLYALDIWRASPEAARFENPVLMHEAGHV
ncbi:DUF4123 domain-containing protein [Litchfieldella rifensis]|uniref:DUF4123 domain-containing protein n=1 Tax=Litchfieldella rifensis TaxID=762643 RepID=A0ABV7LUI8_9GAMM